MPRILVIDDTPSILTEVSRLLREAGHDVVGAPSGREGLAILAREPIDVVVTDVYMPEVDGYEVLRFLRKERRSLPAIAMSAEPQQFDALSAARILGAVKTLWKPFSGEELLSAVASALRGNKGDPTLAASS